MLSAADQSWSDVLTYDAHDARTTIGRYPDGASHVYAMNVATIGKSNVYSSYATAVSQDIPSGIERQVASLSDLRLVYGSETLLVKSNQDGPVTVGVYRSDGVAVLETTLGVEGGVARLHISDLPTGFYVARATMENGTKIICRFVK